MYRYIVAILAIYFFMGFAFHFMNKNNLIIRFLSYLGHISLGIYIIHLFLRHFVEPYYISIFDMDTSLIFICSDFLIKLLVSILLVNLIKKNRYLSMLLIGSGYKSRKINV